MNSAKKKQANERKEGLYCVFHNKTACLTFTLHVYYKDDKITGVPSP